LLVLGGGASHVVGNHVATTLIVRLWGGHTLYQRGGKEGRGGWVVIMRRRGMRGKEGGDEREGRGGGRERGGGDI
jgi:hypothetical protein